MFGKVICVPHTKGGYLDFWGFIKDDGRPLTELTTGSFRTIVHTRQETFMSDLKRLLSERKRDLIHEYYASRKKTAAQRWYGATKALYDAMRDTMIESKIEHTTNL